MKPVLLRRVGGGFRKIITLVELRYPYGKPKVYMNGSLIAIAAKLMAMGASVQVVDFNIDDPESGHVHNLLDRADIIGVSVLGAPYIPSAIEFAKRVAKQYPTANCIMGGQVISGLTTAEFNLVFAETRAIQVRDDRDLAPVLGGDPRENLPSALQVQYTPVWEEMGDERLRKYLQTEFTLVLSQGCAYRCAFCAAEKGQREQFVDLDKFRSDLLFLANAAKRFGLKKLECYASSLDFFQTPGEVEKYLVAIAEVSRDTGVEIRVRCLSCMNSFLRASKVISDFKYLLPRAGLWCIGFGVDGTDVSVWKSQKKGQNRLSDVRECLDLTDSLGIRAEILLVLGFQQDGVKSLCMNVVNAMKYAFMWDHTVLRPYLAKPFIPGNDDWAAAGVGVERVVKEPNKFLNLDFCALGSKLTHPRLWHRWACNLSYLAIIAILTPFRSCVTSPLMPGGSFGKVSQWVNRHMPFDR